MLFTETREGKLANRMRGPFVVTKKHSEVGCQLKHVETGEIIEREHVNRLRIYAGEVEDCDSEGEDVCLLKPHSLKISWIQSQEKSRRAKESFSEI